MPYKDKEKHKEWMRRERNYRIAAGLCTECGFDASPGGRIIDPDTELGRLCYDCREKKRKK